VAISKVSVVLMPKLLCFHIAAYLAYSVAPESLPLEVNTARYLLRIVYYGNFYFYSVPQKCC